MARLRGPSRRDVLKLGGAALGTLAVGCNSETAGNGGPDSGPITSGDGGPIDPPPPDAAPPTGDILSVVDTIVVLMMENRSFDHFLGSLSMRESMAVEGLTGSESNPDPQGRPVMPFQLDDFTPADPPHSWDPSHAQWNMGANDGFVKAHAGANQNDVMGYHVRSQLPSIYGLADQFAICDHWFASVMGPTWPNRFHLHGGTSKGIKSNLPATGFNYCEHLEGLPIDSTGARSPLGAGPEPIRLASGLSGRQGRYLIRVLVPRIFWVLRALRKPGRSLSMSSK